jgi:3',5'-cyclic AMP phosphodiesterase CpdA
MDSEVVFMSNTGKNGEESGIINLLHMSDFHYSSKNDADGVKSIRGNNKRILGEFIDFFRNKNVIKPNIIAITGDIANEGNIEEYMAFHENFLSPFLEIVELTPTDVIFCPGNHDIMRDELEKERGVIDDKELDKVLAYEGVFKDYIKYQDKFFTPLKCSVAGGTGKYEFLSRLSGYRNIGGIHFLSLNSAWFSRTHDWYGNNGNESDFGKLSFGYVFVEDAVKNLRKALKFAPVDTTQKYVKNKDDYVIMLSHHPFFFDTTVGNSAEEPKLFTKTDNTEGCAENKEIRYVSNQYQWLRDDEIFDNDNNYIFGKTLLGAIEEYVDLVLCGHIHKKILPVAIGRGDKGSIGCTTGAMHWGPIIDSKQELVCQIMNIDTRSRLVRICPLIYQSEWLFDKNNEYEISVMHRGAELLNRLLDMLPKFVNNPKKESKKSRMTTLNSANSGKLDEKKEEIGG